jgi:hypothetical protein
MSGISTPTSEMAPSLEEKKVKRARYFAIHAAYGTVRGRAAGEAGSFLGLGPWAYGLTLSQLGSACSEGLSTRSLCCGSIFAPRGLLPAHRWVLIEGCGAAFLRFRAGSLWLGAAGFFAVAALICAPSPERGQSQT